MARRIRPLPLLALTGVWVALWGNVSWINVVSGLVVAAAILVLFPLPPLASTVRVHPVGAARLLARFVADLVASSVRVAALVVRPRPVGAGAIIEVPLTVPDDLRRAIVAEMTSLVPGTVVIDLSARTGVLTLHVLDATDDAALDRERENVRALERRVVAAVGVRGVDEGTRPAHDDADRTGGVDDVDDVDGAADRRRKGERR